MLTNCLAACTHYPSIFNSFLVIRTVYAKKSPFSRTAAHIFVSPGDAPATITMLKSMHKSKNRYFYHILVSPGDASGAITLNVVWMEREFDAYKLSRSMYPSIFNSFPVIRTKCKKSPFSRTAVHIFVSPGDAPATITQYVPWMERQFNACQVSRSMYLSIFNTFRVIRCLSQCVA